MIKLQPIRKNDINKIIKIIADIDNEDSSLAREFFKFYFKKQTSEHKFSKMFELIYNNSIIGCVGYKQKWGDGVYEIIWMYIKQVFQSKGLGSLILRMIEEKLLKEKNARMLVVETGRQRAISFYEKNGFNIKGKIENYYRNKEHSWLLAKNTNSWQN